jgi:fatty acid desaturase
MSAVTGRERIEPRQGLNLAILAVAACGSISFLWLASHTASPWLFMLAVLAFALAGNTLFSLMHEAVHGMLSPNRTVNEACGNIAAALFPTVFVIQRLSHMTHHKNNRSDAERFDYYGPDDWYILKAAQWYSILTGLYWLFIPCFVTLYALTGKLIPWQKFLATQGTLGRQTSAKPYFEALQRIPFWQVQAGFILTVCVQAGLFWFLDLSFWRWFACYYAFGLMWSSLQYADHAFSDLHETEGAWNLRVNRFVRWIFLNYHFHQCHHRDITVPWRKLPGAEKADDKSFSYRDMLYLMWAGPRPLPGSTVRPDALERNNLTNGVFLTAIVFILFFVIYGMGNSFFPGAEHGRDLSTSLDAMIPFVPQASIIYLALGPFLATAPFVLRKPEQLLPYAVAILAELLIALCIFLAWPVAPPPAPYVGNDLTGQLFMLLDFMNLDGNNFPSLHVALAVSATWAYWAHLTRATRLIVCAFTAATVISTLVLHQHIVADVIAGLALAIFGMAIVYPAASRRLLEIKSRLGAAV